MIRYERGSVGLPVGFRRRNPRPTVGARITRAADRFITRVQEWLEGPDRRCELMVAYLLIIAAIAVVVVALGNEVLR